jgi:RHH-type rel operon transcriptional repressor/antitoxin RelB
MLALRLEAELERRIASLARRQGRNKSALVREALIRYMEDQEDIMLAEAALRNLGDGKTLSHEEARRALGLED